MGGACPNCGAPTIVGHAFCSNCGAKIPLAGPPAPQPPAAAPQPPAAPPNPPPPPAPPAAAAPPAPAYAVPAVPPVPPPASAPAPAAGAPPAPPPPYGAPGAPLPPAFGAAPPPPVATAGYAPAPYAAMPAPGYAQPAPGYAQPVPGYAPMSPGIQYAKPMFPARVGAFLIDGLIIGAIGAFIAPIWAFLGYGSAVLAWFFPAIMLAIYKIVLEGQTGQTVGKMVLGVKVVKEDLKPITPSDAQTRSLFIILYPLVIPAFLDIFSASEEGQSFGDKWAHTLVVKA